MSQLGSWCNSSDTPIRAHTLSYLESNATKLPKAIKSLAEVLPSHYANSGRIAHILAKLGKKGAAEYVRTKLPAGSRSRSGDLGEILASIWVNEFTDYRIHILRLRWKDHRELAMRGDDIVAVSRDAALDIRFLKGEVKSRSRLSRMTVREARTALLSSDGRPAPHALAFVSDRLSEAGETGLADLIDEYQLRKRIKTTQLAHLIFVFSGNNPRGLLKEDLQAYKGRIKQYAVGLRVSTHQKFIQQVFDKVIADGDEP